MGSLLGFRTMLSPHELGGASPSRRAARRDCNTSESARWGQARPTISRIRIGLRHVLTCVFLLLAARVQLHGGEETAASLRIGLLTPPDEPEVTCLQQGATLGVELANSTPDHRVELVIRGRPGQWGTEGDEASALALDDAVDVIIAPPGGAASHQVLQVAGRTRVPVISLCPDSSITRTGIPWMIRIVPNTQKEARAIFLGSRTASCSLQTCSRPVNLDSSGFHSVPDFFEPSSETDSRDAVKRVPTRFMGSGLFLSDLHHEAGRASPSRRAARRAWNTFLPASWEAACSFLICTMKPVGRVRPGEPLDVRGTRPKRLAGDRLALPSGSWEADKPRHRSQASPRARRTVRTGRVEVTRDSTGCANLLAFDRCLATSSPHDARRRNRIR